MSWVIQIQTIASYFPNLLKHKKQKKTGRPTRKVNTNCKENLLRGSGRNSNQSIKIKSSRKSFVFLNDKSHFHNEIQTKTGSSSSKQSDNPDMAPKNYQPPIVTVVDSSSIDYFNATDVVFIRIEKENSNRKNDKEVSMTRGVVELGEADLSESRSEVVNIDKRQGYGDYHEKHTTINTYPEPNSAQTKDEGQNFMDNQKSGKETDTQLSEDLNKEGYLRDSVSIAKKSRLSAISISPESKSVVNVLKKGVLFGLGMMMSGLSAIGDVVIARKIDQTQATFNRREQVKYQKTLVRKNKPCKYGPNCKHFKRGKCRFKH